ncbi:MAG: hypothetical protein VKO64_04775 [Candidatus Sericytochromatia bacterium]|nr:hypothetical protein [Candidatus Sericytochromatia bacterium]
MMCLLLLVCGCVRTDGAPSGAVVLLQDSAAFSAPTPVPVSVDAWTGRVLVQRRVREQSGAGILVNAEGSLVANGSGSLQQRGSGRRLLAQAVEEADLPVAGAEVEVTLQDGRTLVKTTDARGFFTVVAPGSKPVALRTVVTVGERLLVLESLVFDRENQPVNFETTLATAGFRKTFGQGQVLDDASAEAFRRLTLDLEDEADALALDALRTFADVTEELERIRSEQEALRAAFDALLPVPMQGGVASPPQTVPSPSASPGQLPSVAPSGVPELPPAPDIPVEPTPSVPSFG